MRPHKKKDPRAIDHIDICIASHFAALRAARGLTHKQIATKIGVSTQQVQKYEAVRSRIAASTLYRIARVFDVPVSTFYVGLPD